MENFQLSRKLTDCSREYNVSDIILITIYMLYSALQLKSIN